LVGTARFELATTCPPDKCATRLRYAPKIFIEQGDIYHPLKNVSRNFEDYRIEEVNPSKIANLVNPAVELIFSLVFTF
jgi:hypothetical protein